MGISHGRDLSPPAAENNEAIILVVGNDAECKSRFAHAVAEARGATPEVRTRAGVQIFRRDSSPVVMDTVQLCTVHNWQEMDTARLWISRNSLRKLGGKPVFVVCIITCSDPNAGIYQEKDLSRKKFSWLHLLACICEEKKQAQVMIMVNFEDMINAASMRRIRKVLNRDGFTRNDNISFVNLRTGDLGSTVQSVLDRSVYRGEAGGRIPPVAAPFFIEEVAPNARYDQKFGPWGPQNVILFGRAGSGKSTLAQMLTLGRLDSQSAKFRTSSGLRGETDRVCEGEGRGWHVVDTPGLGELESDAMCTISESKAKRLIEDHVKLVHGTYGHFFYVWKKDRVDNLDQRFWEVFREVFGEEIVHDYTSVVISGADPDWLIGDENLSYMKSTFKGCESFLTADFPETANDDQELEAENQTYRLKELEDLEDELASLCRLDTSCRLGRWSVSTQLSQATRAVLPILPPMFRETGESSASVQNPTVFVMARLFMRAESMARRMRVN